MDYEKKYNEALAWMRELYPGLHGATKEDAEHYFPELLESEDERMRKELIEYLRGDLDDITTDDTDRWINWLERQKEQKPVEYLPKQKVFDIMNKLTNLSYSERIPIDSEEYVKIHEITSDVNSLLDYPIKPVEWSEEDEAMIKSILFVLESYVSKAECEQNPALTATYPTYYKEIAWLKSLRPPKDCSGCSKHLEGYISGRGDAEKKLLDEYGILIMPEGELHMKARWKPSEEQMKALQNAVALTVCDKELARLYNQLNKL